MRALFYIAETGLSWGRMLMRTDPDRSRHLLTQAPELARWHGFGDVERRATHSLMSA